MRVRRFVAFLLLLAFLMVLGLGAALLTTRRQEPKSYSLVGVVRTVDRETGIVAIRHEAIPGYMPAMTMPFDLKGWDVLDELEPGDEVAGTLQVDRSTSKLTDLRVTVVATAPPETVTIHRKVLEVGAPVPDFEMTTQDGSPLRLSELRGKVVVLTFIYTRCPLPDYCPAMDQKFARLAQLIAPHSDWSDRARLLSVSFDPEHDTPEALSKHARLRGAKAPLWTFAVATHSELRKVAESLGLMYGPTPNEIIHNLTTAVIGPDGKLVRLESGNGWDPADVFKTVAQLAESETAVNPPPRTDPRPSPP